MRLAGIRLNDLIAGLCTVAIGAFALWEASGYPFGDLRRMGSGFFPVMLGVLLMLIGLGIVLEGWLARESDDGAAAPASLAPRAVLAISAALIAFLLLLPRAGLVAAIMAAVVLSSLAERELRPVRVLMLAGGLALACWLIFVVGLNMPLRAFAW